MPESVAKWVCFFTWGLAFGPSAPKILPRYSYQGAIGSILGFRFGIAAKALYLPSGNCWPGKKQKPKMAENTETPVVGIIMGSTSDLKVMSEAALVLEALEVPYELTVVSAHRTPSRMFAYAETAKDRGLKVIVAGAGGAAHLPGMVASITVLPVIGVPVKSSNSIDGWDSVLSILQMPAGVPVATVALDGAKNAGLLAAQIVATADPVLSERLGQFKKAQENKVLEAAKELEAQGWKSKMTETS